MLFHDDLLKMVSLDRMLFWLQNGDLYQIFCDNIGHNNSVSLLQNHSLFIPKNVILKYF